MILRNDVEQNHIYDGKIQEFEKDIVQISLEIGKQRGQNPFITKILTYLLIHTQLTQKQLKELTGCSIGSISTHLAALISIGFVEKKLIPGTHTNIYLLKIDLGQNISTLMKISMNYIKQAQDFLKSKKNELKKKVEQKKNAFQPILVRVEELEYVIGIYIHFLNQIITSKEFDSNLKIRIMKQLDYNQEFDDDFKVIENDFIEFFTYTPMFFGKSDIFSKTFAYFITRKNLNQKQLRELTGLSAGKVSQEINNLLGLEIIEKIDTSETGQITYQMKSVVLAFLNVSFNVLSEYVKWKTKIESINAELENQKEVLRDFDGYEEVLKVVKIYLGVLPFYEQMYNVVFKIKKKVESF